LSGEASHLKTLHDIGKAHEGYGLGHPAPEQTTGNVQMSKRRGSTSPRYLGQHRE
jgi:hypothetical protein